MKYYVYLLETQTTDKNKFLLCLNKKQNNYAKKYLIYENFIKLVVFVGTNCKLDWEFNETLNIIDFCETNSNEHLQNVINNINLAKNAIESINIAIKSYEESTIELKWFINLEFILSKAFDNEYKFSCLKQPKITFIDKSVLKINKNILPPDDTFEFFRSLKYTKNSQKNTKYNINNIETEYNEISHLSKNKNIVIFQIEFIRTFEYLSIIGAFSESTHKYLFVGTNSGHPFIITDEFKYYNSNESGINFPNCDLCVDKQIEMLENFYKKFIKNKCY